MVSVYMSRLSIFETTGRFWQTLARTLCDWEAPQT